MKRMISLLLLFFAAFMLIPMISLRQPESPTPPAGSGAAAPELTGSFQIFDLSTSTVITVGYFQYIVGAVAAEMPASFEPEALKAQAVASFSYALQQHSAQQQSPDPALRGADFSADVAKRVGYMTEEAARAFYGARFETYWDKINDACRAVYGVVATSGGSPIAAAYHAISPGTTEGAGNVWGADLPYLQPVDSAADQKAPNFESTAKFTRAEATALLTAAFPAIALPEKLQNWFGSPRLSASGTVLQIPLGSAALDGQSVRRIFSLRSAAFSVSASDNELVFTVRGYGHGVGLSQYGAEMMAREGRRYDEILKHYYTGIELVTYSV